MGNRIIVLIYVFAAALLALTFVSLIAGRERSLTFLFGPIEKKAIEFSTLDINPKPNQFLVCPSGYCIAKPHLISPVFEMDVEALRQRWMVMVAALPRIKADLSDDQLMQYEYIQRTALLRFPDSITVRFISLGKNRSTLAVYSRSHYGHSDFGTNEARVRLWLSLMQSPGV